MMIDEGFALVGVKLERQAATQDRLLEAVQERGGVAVGIVGAISDEAAVIIEDDAQLGGEHFVIGAAQGCWRAHVS